MKWLKLDAWRILRVGRWSFHPRKLRSTQQDINEAPKALTCSPQSPHSVPPNELPDDDAKGTRSAVSRKDDGRPERQQGSSATFFAHAEAPSTEDETLVNVHTSSVRGNANCLGRDGLIGSRELSGSIRSSEGSSLQGLCLADLPGSRGEADRSSTPVERSWDPAQEANIPSEPPIDEDAAREDAYVRFDGEAEEDYTEGPSRFVLATDGIKPSVALLMKLDLSSKIQLAIRAQRELANAEQIATREEESNYRFERELERLIGRRRLAIAEAEEASENDARSRADVLHEELERLHLLLANTKAKRQASKARLDTQADNLRQKQAGVNAYLEDAFVNANLIEPAEAPRDSQSEVLDVKEEYQKLSEAIREQLGGQVASASSVASLQSCGEHLQPLPMDAGAQAKLNFRNAYLQAQQKLHAAQRAFDDRELARDREEYENWDAVERGEQGLDAGPLEFDLRWVVQNRQLTRDLIEAEAAEEEARAALLADGLNLAVVDGQASHWGEDMDDSLESSEEGTVAANVVQKIWDWVEGIPHDADPQYCEEPGLDDWPVEAVEISDSVSMIAEDPSDRRRIDEWNKERGL